MLKNIGLIIARRTFVDSTVCISWCRRRFHIFPGPFPGTLRVSNRLQSKIKRWTVQREKTGRFYEQFDTFGPSLLILAPKFDTRSVPEIGTGKIVQLCFRVCFKES